MTAYLVRVTSMPRVLTNTSTTRVYASLDLLEELVTVILMNVLPPNVRMELRALTK